jgi:hypothetical protein
MTRHPKTGSRARLLRSLYIWHRYFGLAAVLFVVVLCTTGIALNHTDSLRLDSRYVRSDALLDWYGIHAPASIRSYRAGACTISQVGDQVYWNTRRLPAIEARLQGAVSFAGLVIVALEDSLLLFTEQGELIEQLGTAAGVPAPVRAIGLTTGGLVVKTTTGSYRTEENLLDWKAAPDGDITWAAAQVPAEELAQALHNAYRGSGLPLERVLLDLHSGRILGEPGVWLVDTAAVLFLILAGSGVWLWVRRRASVREHRRSGHSDGGQR